MGTATQTRKRIDELVQRGAAAGEQKDTAAAADVLSALIALDWQNPQAFSVAAVNKVLDLAGRLLQLGDFDLPVEQLYWGALRVYEQSAQAGFNEIIVALQNLQVLYARCGDANNRSRVLSHCVQLAANYRGPLNRSGVSALFELIRLFEHNGYMEAVLDLYRPLAGFAREASDLAPVTRLSLSKQFGDALANNARHAEALEAFEQAAAYLDDADAEVAPWRIPLFAALASAATLSGQTERADQAYTVALQALDEDESADPHARAVLYYNAAVFWLENGYTDRFPRAETLLSQALEQMAHSDAASTLEYALGLIQAARLALTRNDAERAAHWLSPALEAADPARHADADVESLKVLADAASSLAQGFFDTASFTRASDASYLAVRVRAVFDQPAQAVNA